MEITYFLIYYDFKPRLLSGSYLDFQTSVFLFEKCMSSLTRAYNGGGKHREETCGLISFTCIDHAFSVDKAD